MISPLTAGDSTGVTTPDLTRCPTCGLRLLVVTVKRASDGSVVRFRECPSSHVRTRTEEREAEGRPYKKRSRIRSSANGASPGESRSARADSVAVRSAGGNG